MKFQPVSNFGGGGGGVVLSHHENFARKLCKIHWITEQTWLWSGNGIMDAQTPKIIAGWISQWVYVEQYPWPFITSSSGVMDTITVSSSFTSIYSTIPPATKSCQLGKNKCYYFSLMYLFIALNKVLFSINERVGHLGGKEVNREFRHWRFLACEQALRGALVAGRQKEASDYSSTSFSPRLVQLQRNKIQGLFKDKFQFLRSKIYSINWRSLAPF